MLKLSSFKSFKKYTNFERNFRKYIHYPFHTRKIGVQGAPFELGQRKPGVIRGPEALRETEFIEILQEIVGLDVKDYGDVEFVSASLKQDPSSQELQLPDFRSHKYKPLSKILARNELEVGTACQKIAESTMQIIQDNRICLTLGGDHSIAIGTIAGASKIFKKLGIIWIDAHSDINTSLTSLTGNMHGMGVSFILKELESYYTKPPSFQWLIPQLTKKSIVSAKSLVYIGLRDVESVERSIINMLGIKAFSMYEVDKYGINFVVEMALDYLAAGGVDRPLHISFDVDALDDLEIPCTGTPVPGGLTLREGLRMMEVIHHSCNVCSIDMVEFNPSLGKSSQALRSAKALQELIFSCFGYYRGGLPSVNTAIPKPSISINQLMDPDLNQK